MGNRLFLCPPRFIYLTKRIFSTGPELEIMPKKILFIALLTVIVFTFIINAWICDDAYISFRVIDNAINGYGLSWNTGERVQVFTHPLWLILLIPFQFISGEAYFTTIIVSLALIIGAVLLVRRITGSNQLAFVLFIAALISSQAFIDYSTSGLGKSPGNFSERFVCLLYAI